MPISHMLVLALATWRLSNLLVNEAGPFDLFARLRFAAGIVVDPASEEKYAADERNEVAQMLLCVWCTSIWVAAALLLAYVVWPAGIFGFALGLSLSAVACLLDSYTEGASP